ncbi:MAG: phage holin family protein [Acidobacteriota bacterium]|nr:phage holin family protein [Acidobacteriota bacterium]
MPRNEERSVSDVLQDILGNLQDIVRSEVQLAKAEVKMEAGHTAKAAKPLIAGAVLSLYAGGLLLAALVLGLSLVLPPWIAALAVGVLIASLGATLIAMGRARLRGVHSKSEETIETMKEDVAWLKDQSR